MRLIIIVNWKLGEKSLCCQKLEINAGWHTYIKVSNQTQKCEIQKLHFNKAFLFVKFPTSVNFERQREASGS